MDKITEHVIDNIVHGVIKNLNVTGIKFDADKMSDLNEFLTDFFIDECQIEVEEFVAFEDLSKCQQKYWKDIACTLSQTPKELFESHSGMNNNADKNIDVQHSFNLIDESASPSEFSGVNGYIDNSNHLGLSVHFEGYSDSSPTGSTNPLIYIEKYNSSLRAIIYADINQDEPTNVICLEKAKISNRKDRVIYEMAIVE